MIYRDKSAGKSWGGKAGRRKLFLVVLMVAAVVAVRLAELERFLDREALQRLVTDSGMLGPLLYISLYALATVLFLPGLPMTIAGGIVFGPVWGVVYTMAGATAGASLAFLGSRYIARDWIDSKLSDPRWRKLDDQVREQGWKVVAVTRLVPLFPFNLLNYAFGL